MFEKKNKNFGNAIIKDAVLEIEDQLVNNWSASWVRGKVTELARKLSPEEKILFAFFMSCSKFNKKLIKCKLSVFY